MTVDGNNAAEATCSSPPSHNIKHKQHMTSGLRLGWYIEIYLDDL